MLSATHKPFAPWFIVNADDKRRARLNCIAHLLSLIQYEEIPRKRIKLPKRQQPNGYKESTRRYKPVSEKY